MRERGRRRAATEAVKERRAQKWRVVMGERRRETEKQDK